MKWIRWQGLAAFIIVTVLICVLWYVLIDGYIERSIERAGTAIVGAKVELDSADLSLFPLGLTLRRLQVTDAEEPMQNAVEIARIAFLMDAGNLLMRKVIIEEMTVDGVRFGTPRKTSGALRKAAASAGGPSLLEKFEVKFPPLEVPDVKKVLQEEDLESLKLAESLKAKLEDRKAFWEERLKSLPGKDQIEQYKERIDKLKAAKSGGIGGALGAVGDVTELKNDIERDVALVRSSIKEFGPELESLKKDVESAKAAPMNDVHRLREKYSLSAAGLKNMSRALFGEKISGMIGKALIWRERLNPLLEHHRQTVQAEKAQKPPRGKGLDISFREYRPMPEFLARLIRASVELKAGEFSGTLKNVTNEQPLVGLPLELAFSGDNLKDVSSIRLRGVIDRTKPGRETDTAGLSVKGYGVKDVRLSSSSDLPLTIKDGQVDMDIEASVREKEFNASVSARLGSLALDVPIKEDAGAIPQAVASALKGVRSFGLDVAAAGTKEDYDITVSSDLDGVLRDAASGLIRDQARRFEAELREAVLEKTEGPIADLTAGLGGFSSIGGDLKGRESQLDSLLSDALKAKTGGLKLPF